MEFETTVRKILETPIPSDLSYTAIGAPNTPRNIQAFITKVAAELSGYGCTLRTGGEETFEMAAAAGASRQEVYLPYKRFNKNDSELYVQDERSYEIAKDINRTWHRCSEFAKKCHARYVHAVLGRDLESPSAIMLCWTGDGATREQEVSSKTGTVRGAIVLAERQGIPVLNLRRRDHVDLLISCLRPTVASAGEQKSVKGSVSMTAGKYTGFRTLRSVTAS
jgi:hypothetical protein